VGLEPTVRVLQILIERAAVTNPWKRSVPAAQVLLTNDISAARQEPYAAVGQANFAGARRIAPAHQARRAGIGMIDHWARSINWS
jgi:hypothetical protein